MICIKENMNFYKTGELTMKKDRRTFLNLQYGRFLGVGNYEVPIIKKENIEIPKKWIGFNEVNTYKGECTQTGVHFFIDDYQFERVWQRPTVYLRKLSKFKVVASPDFSLYTDYPSAMQIWNTYRKQWIGSYFQNHGIHVIPTVSWSDEKSYKYCFDGIEKESTVILTDKGIINDEKSKELWKKGYEEMKRRIKPSKILLIKSKNVLKSEYV